MRDQLDKSVSGPGGMDVPQFMAAQSRTDARWTSNDLVESYRLPAEVGGNEVIHRRFTSDRANGRRKVMEVKTWRRVRELGRGGCGTVWLEQEKQAGQLRAVKEIRKYRHRANKIEQLHELLAMANLSRAESSFVRFDGWYETPDHIYIAMEYLELGDLEQCVPRPLPEIEVRCIVFQIAEALVFMHERSFAHRDLKPSNVFVVTKGPRWWVKLADFGVSKRIRSDDTFLHTTMDGDFVAPEVAGILDPSSAENTNYTKEVDMWSLGCLTHWMLTKKVPIPRRDLLRWCMNHRPCPQQRMLDTAISSRGVEFVSRLITRQPGNRMTAVVCLHHGWPLEDAGELVPQAASTQQIPLWSPQYHHQDPQPGTAGHQALFFPTDAGKYLRLVAADEPPLYPTDVDPELSMRPPSPSNKPFVHHNLFRQRHASHYSTNKRRPHLRLQIPTTPRKPLFD